MTEFWAKLPESVRGLLEVHMVDDAVLMTMTETDFLQCGIELFGQRRKLTLMVEAERARREQEAHAARPGQEAQTELPVQIVVGVADGGVEQTGAAAVSAPSNIHVVMVNTKHADYYDVKTLLNDNALYDKCVKGEDAARKLMINKIVRKCADDVWNGKEYPVSDEKEALARAIVTAFPKFASTVEGDEGFEPFFNRGTNGGFLQWKLKKLQAKLPEEQKCRKRHMEEAGARAKLMCLDLAIPPINSSSERLSLVTMQKDLMYLDGTAEGRPNIHKLWKQTFKLRREFIKTDRPYAHQVVESYPKLKTFPELMELELQLMSPGYKNRFATQWARVVDNALTLDVEVEENAVVTAIGKDALAMQRMLKFLHRPNTTKRKKNASCSKEETFGLIFQDVSNLDQEKELTQSQPCIMRDTRQGQLYIRVQPDLYFECPATYSYYDAFVRLYSSFWTFNVDYPLAIDGFWGVVQHLFGMKPTVSPKEAMLLTALRP